MSSAADLDVVVIGAGVVGLALARALALAGRDVTVVERESAAGCGVSARSSEVIHAGIYYAPGSLKARLCVAGRRALYDYCESRGVPHKRCGKLIVAHAAQADSLGAIAARAQAAGVELTRLDGSHARALEPDLSCALALHSPHTGIVDSHALMLALQGDAEAAGVVFAFNTPVIGGRASDERATLVFGGAEPFEASARVIVIAAGLSAPRVAASIAGLSHGAIPRAFFAKGSYFTLAGRAPFSRLVYPVPQAGGLGVHLTLDLAGRARFGPDVEWLSAADESEIDYRVDPARANAFYAAIRGYWPGLPDGALEPAYAGVRPKIAGPGAPDADFLVLGPQEHGAGGVFGLYGVESPGLTSSLAIADHLARIIEPGAERICDV
jgi:L-2-hydroxyglutarate oxidase LhgO